MIAGVLVALAPIGTHISALALSSIVAGLLLLLAVNRRASAAVRTT